MSDLPDNITPQVLEAIADRVAAILGIPRLPERDLATEIEGWLADHEPARVPQIAFGVGARESVVGRVVASDHRFRRDAVPPDGPRASTGP